MMSALLVAATLFSALQDPPPLSEVEVLRKQVEELRAELEKVKKEAAAQKWDAEQLEKFSKEAAEEIVRLRTRVRELETAAAAVPSPSPSPSAGPVAGTPEPAFGPDKVLTGRVLDVEPKFNFITINIGETDGVKIGYRFEIARREKDGSTRRIAVGEVEKFIGEAKKYSKIKIMEGSTAEIRFEDEAIAFRRVEAPKPTPTGTKPMPGDGPRKYVVTGINGETFFINYGRLHGARQGDLVYCYMNRKLRAKLRLEQVDEDWSSAKIVDGTKLGEVSLGDELATKEEKTTAIGKVRFNDAKRGLMIDIGSQTHGARMGQRFEVRRNGRKVGELAIVKLDKLFSLAEATGELKREEVQVDDIVESID